MKKGFFGFALMALAALAVPSAEAATFTVVGGNGQTANVNFALDPNGGAPPGPLTATAALTVASIDSDTLVLNVLLTNTTTFATAGVTPVGLASFGFSINPNAIAPISGTTTANGQNVAGDTNVFAGYSFDDIPSLTLVEICSWAGNNCNGGAQGGLLHFSEFDHFQITLNFAGTNTQYVLENFGVKFQTNAGSYEFYEGTGTGFTPTDDGIVTPEPALLSMLGLGLVGAAYRIRRRR